MKFCIKISSVLFVLFFVTACQNHSPSQSNNSGNSSANLSSVGKDSGIPTLPTLPSQVIPGMATLMAALQGLPGPQQAPALVSLQVPNLLNSFTPLTPSQNFLQDFETSRMAARVAYVLAGTNIFIVQPNLTLQASSALQTFQQGLRISNGVASSFYQTSTFCGGTITKVTYEQTNMMAPNGVLYPIDRTEYAFSENDSATPCSVSLLRVTHITGNFSADNCGGSIGWISAYTPNTDVIYYDPSGNITQTRNSFTKVAGSPNCGDSTKPLYDLRLKTQNFYGLDDALYSDDAFDACVPPQVHPKSPESLQKICCNPTDAIMACQSADETWVPCGAADPCTQGYCIQSSGGSGSCQ